MFTGLTSQVTNWMGGAKKGDEEEKVTSPSADNEGAAPDGTSDAKKDSVSGGSGGGGGGVGGVGGRLEMLSNVKSQMSGWIGSGIAGLRKSEDPTATAGSGTAPEGGDPAVDAESPASERSVKGSPGDPKEEGDDSSATGGADSDGPPTDDEGEEKDAAGNSVSTKALQGAKSFGSFLYSAVNKAGKTVSEAGAKIKKTVEENSFLSDFNKEQDQFIAERSGKDGAPSVPPWVGFRNEESLKAECLSLSSDRRNFVRDPPAGVDFAFDLEASMAVARAVLAEDPNLEKMRFELVPKVVTEEVFWRNYFYRVNLLCQQNELSNMATDSGSTGIGNRQGSADAEPAVETPDEVSRSTTKADVASALGDFVSDDFHVSSKALDDVREGMQKLGIGVASETNATEEWEKELEAELQDYEMVADGDGHGSSSATATSTTANWEHQIEDMLDDDLDLK